jgi:hypothetical protein
MWNVRISYLVYRSQRTDNPLFHGSNFTIFFESPSIEVLNGMITQRTVSQEPFTLPKIQTIDEVQISDVGR